MTAPMSKCIKTVNKFSFKELIISLLYQIYQSYKMRMSLYEVSYADSIHMV